MWDEHETRLLLDFGKDGIQRQHQTTVKTERVHWKIVQEPVKRGFKCKVAQSSKKHSRRNIRRLWTA